LGKWNRHDFMAADLLQRRMGAISLSLRAKGALKSKLE
jgi:hypothetical protein